tara:strand:+ start:983 stop:1297 length:315 start_codon:yes stop_codon:yes gene_type:complete
MGKNKEEFMKDREKEAQYVIHNHNLIDDRINDFHCLIDNVNDKMIGLEEELSNNELRVNELIGELEETKRLLSKSKTLISNIFIEDYNDVRRQKEELLTELKDY